MFLIRYVGLILAGELIEAQADRLQIKISIVILAHHIQIHDRRCTRLTCS